MTSIQYYPGYSQVQVHTNLQIRQILDISNSYPMIVTTSEPHRYPAGMLVRFRIPPRYTMQQLNAITAQVLAVTESTLLISVDSRAFENFSYPTPLAPAYTPPFVLPEASGPPLGPYPLPYGNQDTFDGVIYNDGINNGN